MSRKQENTNRLNLRERELTAIGAAIASNCVPCIEYHIPQARKAGLTDSEIREAVDLADKVRRVPADKVLQTAFALLDEPRPAQEERENNGCGCSGPSEHPRERAAHEPSQVRVDDVGSRGDNKGKDDSCNEAGNRMNACGSEGTSIGSENDEDQTGFDFSKMMEMMQKCCPGGMKDVSSMMANFDSRRRPSTEEDTSKESA